MTYLIQMSYFPPIFPYGNKKLPTTAYFKKLGNDNVLRNESGNNVAYLLGQKGKFDKPKTKKCLK